MKNVFVLLAISMAAFLSLETNAHAQLFGRRDTVRVRVRGDDVRVRANGNSAVAVNAFGGNRNAVAVNVNGGFAPARVNVVRGVPLRANFNGRVFVEPQLRVNAFGVRSLQDGFGNVIEVDAFGNARFAGNTFNRGFQGTVFRSSSFDSFSSFGAVPFAGCCH